MIWFWLFINSGPPEPVFKLEQMTATNSVTTTMTPTAVEVQMEPPGNNTNAPPGVKNEQQQNLQQAQAVENGNMKKDDENKELIGKESEFNPQHNSGYDPAPTDEAMDDIEKELANINWICHLQLDLLRGNHFIPGGGG